jgi:MFS family permease
MNRSSIAIEKPTGVRYGVLGFACSLSMITYLDRVCFGTVASDIQSEFGLSETQKGLLFSAFTLSYASLEVPSGWLGDRFGPKKTLIRIVLAWSTFTVMTGLIYPGMLGLSMAFAALLAVRFLFGAGEAGAYPNIARAFHNWFPFHERGFAKGMVWMAGRFAGGITGFLVLALLFETGATDRHLDPVVVATTTVGLAAGPMGALSALTPQVAAIKVTHWRHVFWVFGAIGALWTIAFSWWFKDRPEHDPRVNPAELALIHRGEDRSGPARAVPWGQLLTSTNLWILCLMYFCASYGWYFNITYLPGYLRQTFGLVDQEKWTWAWWQFGLMVGAPLLLGACGCLVGGVLSDLFIKRTGNRKWGRRLFGVVGHGLCGLCYFLAIFADSAGLFVLAIALASFWNDMTMGAAWASCLDIGKKYSGIVAGCMNSIGNLGGVAAGFLTGRIIDFFKGNVPQGASQATILDAGHTGWTVNFVSFSVVYVIAALLWLGFDATKPVARQ